MTTSFSISVMGTSISFEIHYSIYEFCVFGPDGGKVADGYFTPYKSRNHVAFFPTCYVELFSDAFEKRVIKEIKKDRLFWSEMVNYQRSKKY